MDKTTPDPLIGRAISQYEVVARIGGGGMGVVYKATDQKLGRAVALKFLPPQWSHDEGAKQRFLREAQAASATNHRNICIIHDIAQTDDGQLFIVMAYYEGQTLKQKLEAGPLPAAEALEIAAEMAEGLAKAHAQGVVHRDVKPGNLMITDDGVKVLDFGLAKFADSLQLTMAGSTIGTVAYMSPEQARGEEADARSDVWALGVVLYEMLSGRVPFKGAYPEAIFHAIKNEPVPPLRVPSAPAALGAPLGGADREIPPALEMLVLRALEKDPERRYQSAREVARDLRLLQGRTVPLDLRTEPLPLLPGLAAPQPLSWSQRMRRAVTPARAIAAMVAVAVALGGTYAWMTRPVVRIPVAIAPVANHTGEPELDNYRLALTATLLDELGESPNIRVVPYLRLVEIVRQYVGAGNFTSSEAIQAIATQSGARFVVMPSFEYRRATNTWLAQAQVRNVETGAVIKTLETEAATSSLPRDTASRLMTSLADGIQAHFKANGPGRSYSPRPVSSRFRNLEAARAFEEGLDAYEQLEYSTALAAFRKAISQDGQHAMAHAWLSRVALMMYQSDEAAESARRARQLVTTDTSSRDAAFIDAVVADSQSDFATAEKRYRQLTALQPDDAAARMELADFLKRQRRDQEAISAYREVLRLDAGYIRPHVDLCQLYTRVDDYPLAEQEANAAKEKYRAAANRPGEAQALLALSELQRRQRKLAGATEAGQDARNIFEPLGLPYGLSRVYQYLGAAAADGGDFPAAAQLFEEALSRSRAVGNRLTEGAVLQNLGVAYERMAQRTKAIDYYQQSHDVYQQNGDEQRAAEQEANAASLLIDYGSNQAEGLRRVTNARAMFHKLGYVEFEVIAMEAEAASALHAGRHAEARQQLRAALSLANDHKVSRAASISVKLAESYFATSDYGTSRDLLEKAAATATGRDDAEVLIALGRVYAMLGAFDRAREHLEMALTAIQTSGQLALAPSAYTALGEVEYQSRNIREAAARFEKAAAFWTDDLPDAASVEARCYLASIDALPTKAAAALARVGESVNQASKMGRLYSEALCRLHEAGIRIANRQPTEAIAALGPIPLVGDRAVGRELQAQVHYWRSRAMAQQGNRGDAASEAAQARQLVKELQASTPAPYRDGFGSRADIRRILEEDPVRQLR